MSQKFRPQTPEPRLQTLNSKLTLEPDEPGSPS